MNTIKHLAHAAWVALLWLPFAAAATDAKKLPIRVVVVTTFEAGADTGDAPGEFQAWVEKLPLAQTLPFPAGCRPLRYNPKLQVLGIVTCMGPSRVAASITALGHDARFDLSHAYVLLAGIAGVDPNTGTVGSAAWAQYVVEGSHQYEIDAREIPADWPDGFVADGQDRPQQHASPALLAQHGDSSLFTLDPGLVNWAYQFTRARPLPDSPLLQAIRAPYQGYPQAQQPPQVMRGDVVASGVFWVGKHMNAWAERWMAFWTQGKGRFVMTAEEDAGMMQALTYLAQDHKVDLRRVLVLRTGSNFDLPPPGKSAAGLLHDETLDGHLSGYLPSLDAAYRVGSPVVRELAEHWSRYENQLPRAPATP
jgi:purine nucleoside permease